MKVIGKKTKSMDKERNSVTIKFMKVISNMIQKMEMEYFNGKMEMFILVNVKMIINMETAKRYTKMEKFKKETG